MTTQLPLYEEILLIALDDEKGTTGFEDMSKTALGGAILAELVLEGAVRIPDAKKKHVTANPGARVNDPILAEALEKVRQREKPRKAADWVRSFAGLKDLKHRAARQLVAKGILTEETGTVLKIFKRRIYPEADGGPERALVVRLEEAIFTATPNVDQRTVIVIALAQATDLLKRVIDKKRLKSRKERLKKITSGEIVGNATKEAVEAIQAAVMVAVMVPLLIAASD